MPDETRRTTIAPPDSRTPAATASRTRNAAPSIRYRLATLVLALTLPIVAFAYLLVSDAIQRERAILDTQMLATARATSIAIDNEINGTIRALGVLSGDTSLKQHDWQAFYGRMQDAIRPGMGDRFILYDPAGRALLTTSLPYGAALPPKGNAADDVQHAARTGRPQITNLVVAATADQTRFVIALIPVFEGGQVAYVLGGAIPVARLNGMIATQMLSAGWSFVIDDRDGTILARTIDPEHFIGRRSTPQLVAAWRATNEGFADVPRLEGITTHLAFVRSSLSGWATVLSVDEPVLRAQTYVAVLRLGGGGAVLLLLALLFAAFYGRRIAQPVAALSVLSEKLGRGEPLPHVHLGLAEAQIVANGLEQASTLLAKRSAERDALLASLEERVRSRTQELAESEARYRAAALYSRSLLDASLDPLVAIDASGRITDANAAALRATGRPRIALIGSEFADCFTEPDRARAAYRAAFAQGAVTDYALSIRHIDGHTIQVLYNASVYRDEKGMVTGVLAAAREVPAPARRADENSPASALTPPQGARDG